VLIVRRLARETGDLEEPLELGFGERWRERRAGDGDREGERVKRPAR
jgi:hypothetical protein